MSQSNDPSAPNAPRTGETDPAKIAQIEAEIGQTRNAISGDLRTLGERLSPDALKEDAREVMNEAKNAARETLQEAKNVATSTFREVKDSALDTVSEKVDEIRGNVREVEREALGFVRDNAVPLALIGVGLAWFVSNRRRRERDASWEGEYAPRGEGRWRYPPENRSGALGDARNGLSRASGSARQAAYQAKERAQGWVEGAEHRASDVAGRVQGFAEREAAHVRTLAEDAERRLGRATGKARDAAGRELREVRELTRRTTESHPLAVGAAAVAAGVCVGLLIPTTQREGELFGAQRERLLDEAKGAVQDWTDTAKGAVQDWTDTAKGAARDVKSSLGNVGG